MAEGEAAALRLRLEFTRAVLPRAKDGRAIAQRCWFQPPPGLATAGDLAAAIAEEFGLSVTSGEELQLLMDGFVVLRSSSVDLIRDGDLVKVQRAPKPQARGNTAAAVAVTAGKAGAEGGGAPALALTAPLADAGPKASSKRKATAQQARAAKKVAPAKAAVPAAAAANESSAEEASSSDDEESSSEEESTPNDEESSSEEAGEMEQAAHPAAPAAAPKKTPSRNARRKAIKRRLRREGVLPGMPRPAANGAAQAPAAAQPAGRSAAAAAAAATPSGAAEAPGQLAAVPGLQWASQGHVHFGDSDGEGGEAAQAAVQQQPTGFQAHSGRFSWQTWDQSRKQDRKQKRAGQRHAAAAAISIKLAQDDRPRPLPQVDEDRLQPLEGEPRVGDVLSYRLLEIGEDFTPQVSAQRRGCVTAWDAGSQEISLEPWPQPGIHPVWAERAAAAGMDYHDYVEQLQKEGEDEELPTEYSEDGSLTVPFANLADVAALSVTMSFGSPSSQRRPVAAAPAAVSPAVQALSEQQPQPAVPRALSETRALATPRPSGVSLGPPRPASTGPPPRPAGGAASGRVVPSLSAWNEISRQLQKRRAELAVAVAHGTATPSAPASLPRAAEAAVAAKAALVPAAGSAAACAAGAPTSKSPVSGRQQQGNEQHAKPTPTTAQRGAMTRGAVPPRGGVRHAALGSVLRRLRDEKHMTTEK